MGRYLLDTSVLIDFSKGREPALSQVRTWIEGGDVLAVCQVVVAEFYTGLSAEQADKWRRFILSLTY